MRHVVLSCSTFLPSNIKIFQRVFKLQSGREVLRRRRRDPSQKQYAPPPFGRGLCVCVCVWGGGGGGGGHNISKCNLLKKYALKQYALTLSHHVSQSLFTKSLSLIRPVRVSNCACTLLTLCLFIHKTSFSSHYPQGISGERMLLICTLMLNPKI